MYNNSKIEKEMSAYGIYINKNICKRYLKCFIKILYFFMLEQAVFHIALTNLKKKYNYMKYGKILAANVL